MGVLTIAFLHRPVVIRRFAWRPLKESVPEFLKATQAELTVVAITADWDLSGSFFRRALQDPAVKTYLAAQSAEGYIANVTNGEFAWRWTEEQIPLSMAISRRGHAVIYVRPVLSPQAIIDTVSKHLASSKI